MSEQILTFIYKAKEDMLTDLEIIDSLTPAYQVPLNFYIIKSNKYYYATIIWKARL